MPGPTLGDLAEEILVYILWKIHWKDLSQCRLVSRHFEQVINDSQLLYYSLELGRLGFRHRSASRPFNVSDCIVALHNVENLWKDLCFTKVNESLIPFPSEDWEDRWESYGTCIISSSPNPVSGQSSAQARSTSNQIVLVDIDDLLDGNSKVPIKKTLTFDIDFPGWDHDIYKDLIILYDSVNMSLHFLSSLDQGLKPYSLAQVNPLYIGRQPHHHVISGTCITGDFILVHVVGETQHETTVTSYYLYNWLTGEKLKEWVSMTLTRFDNYRIRTDTRGNQYLLLTGIQQNPFGGAIPFLNVYSLPHQYNRNVRLLATYLLPPLSSTLGNADHLVIHAGPRNAVPRKSAPFETSHALLVLELSQELWFITHLSTVLSPAITQQASGDIPQIFPWEVWGPQTTRAMYSDTSDFNTVLLGTRIILNNRLLDFDQRRVAKAQQDGLFSVSDSRDTLQRHLLAEKKVTTGLPYIWKAIDIPSSDSPLAYFLDIIECMDGPRLVKYYCDDRTVRFLDIIAMI